MSEQDYEDGGEINHIIHEGRAEKRGLQWNRERYRFENQAGEPIHFLPGGSWVVITEEEWERRWLSRGKSRRDE